MTTLAQWFTSQSPLLQATLAGLFTWLLTAAGALAIFTRRQLPPTLLDGMLGFAAGIMLAASFWSLLSPSIGLAEVQGIQPWIPVGGGFLLGVGFLRVVDRLLPHLHGFPPGEVPQGVKTGWQRSTLLLLAITVHNIPEGLALGVAFGATALGPELANGATLGAAVALAMGLGLQNVPEGVAVAMPLRRDGAGRLRSFWWAQFSASVEPAAAALGAAAVLAVQAMLPWALSFAAGAMIYVVAEELWPEAKRSGNGDLAAAAAAFGFVLMTTLDLTLG